MFYVDAKTIQNYTPDDRLAIISWLRSHDIDTANLVSVKVVGRQLFCSEFKLDGNGRPVTNRQGDEIKTRRCRVQMRSDPPKVEAVI